MATPQLAAPRCWIEVHEIVPHPSYHTFDENGRWRPPRARGTNIVHPHQPTRWFQFANWSINPVQRPNIDLNTYRCNSVYYYDGAFWVYHGDATTKKVGDGTPAMPNANEDSESEEESDDEREGDAESDDESDPGYDDWQPLKFEEPRSVNGTSYAGTRDTETHVQHQGRPNINLQHLLPPGYLNDAQPVAQGYGGINGPISLLIALVVLSVPREFPLIEALRTYLGRTYTVPHWPRGTGWRNYRGVVVTVHHEVYRGNVPHQNLTNSLRSWLQWFERGHLRTFAV